MREFHGALDGGLREVVATDDKVKINGGEYFWVFCCASGGEAGNTASDFLAGFLEK